MALLALFRSPIFTAAPRATPPLPLGGDVTGEAQQVLLALSFPEMIGQRPLISCSSNEGLLGTFQNLPALLGVRAGRKMYTASAISGNHVTAKCMSTDKTQLDGRSVQKLAYAK